MQEIASLRPEPTATVIEATVGWRYAVIDEFKYASAPALKEDGTNLELDYTGYIVKVGAKFLFNWSGGEDRPDID